MIKNPTVRFAAVGVALLVLPVAAAADTLELPADASVAVQVIDELSLDGQAGWRDDILLRPVGNGVEASHELPEYCVLVGNARRDDERLRITTQALTCIEAQGEESEIFSGELSAAAYETDGSYGLAVCDSESCRLAPDQAFQLQLQTPLSLEPQENPSAKLNEQRRQAGSSGVANPLPAERPDPDSE